MSYNVTEEYFKRLNNNYNAYFKLILENRYNKQICERLMEVYINVRYGMAEYTSRAQSIKNKLIIELRERKTELLAEFPDKDKEIEEIYVFSDYVIDFDNFANEKYLEYLRELSEKELKENKGKRYLRTSEKVNELSELYKDLVDLRAKRLGKAIQEEFVKELKLMIAENIDEKIDLLARSNNNEFYLRITEYPKQKKVKRVKIRYNLDFPMLYSISAIEQVYQEDLINEDKLILCYYLVSVKVLNDTMLGQFNREYIVDFPASIIDKIQKRERLTNILNHDLVKERVFIKITNREFEENTEYIYSLTREGYRFAIVIDSTFKPNYANLERLNIFKYIITHKNLPTSREVKNISKLREKIIELGDT